MRLNGKRAVITGAGGGIGRATAIKCAAEGAAVLCCDIRSEAAAETADDHRRRRRHRRAGGGRPHARGRL